MPFCSREWFSSEDFPKLHKYLPSPSWSSDTEEVNVVLMEYHVTLLVCREPPLLLTLTYVNWYTKDTFHFTLSFSLASCCKSHYNLEQIFVFNLPYALVYGFASFPIHLILELWTNSRPWFTLEFLYVDHTKANRLKALYMQEYSITGSEL